MGLRGVRERLRQVLAGGGGSSRGVLSLPFPMILCRLLYATRPRYSRSTHTLKQKLVAAADILLTSPLSPAGVSPYEKVALGTLAVFSRTCSFYDLPSPKQNKPLAQLEGDVWSGVSFSDAADTIHRLCVSIQLDKRISHNSTSPLAHRISADPRFSLLLQCASYHLSRGVITPSTSGFADEYVHHSTISRCMLDLCLLAKEAKAGTPQSSMAQSNILLSQLSDAFCQTITHLPADSRVLELSLAPSLDALRALSHWDYEILIETPPLAALDVLASHFIRMASFFISNMNGEAALVYVEAAALFHWWDKKGPPSPSSVNSTLEGPKSTCGRYSFVLEAMVDAIYAKFPKSLPDNTKPASLQRCAHQSLFIAARNSSLDTVPSNVYNGVFNALLSFIRTGKIHHRTRTHSASMLSSFSSDELISSLHTLSQCCTPARLTTRGQPFNANAVCARNALLRDYVLELQSRVQAYESGYLSEVLNGGGGPLGFVEPGASFSVCNQRRLYLKKYTAAGIKKLVNDDGGILTEGFNTLSYSHLISKDTGDVNSIKSLFLEGLQGCGHFLPPLPESHFKKGTGTFTIALSPSQLFSAMSVILPLCAAPTPTSELSPGDASLSRAAFTAAMALCDLAVVQALAGESSGRDECALAGLCAEGGLQHRGFFSAMGRRMVGRGSNRGVDPRLSTIPTPLIISLLHALCMAWEFDEDAFTMAILELQVRDAAGEWGASEKLEGGGEEERGVWGEGAALFWKTPTFLDSVFLGSAETGKFMPFSSSTSILSPVPDFLWDRGSSIDWDTSQSGTPFTFPWDFKTVWKLHQILTTLGTVTKFPQLVWQVPRILREKALSVSPFIHPLPTSPAFGYIQHLPFGGDFGCPSFPPLESLSRHCVAVLRSSIPAISSISPQTTNPMSAIASKSAPPSEIFSWLLQKGLGASREMHTRRAKASSDVNFLKRRGGKCEIKSPSFPLHFDSSQLSLRSSTYLDLLREPHILEALKEEGITEVTDVGEMLVAPLYASDCGVVIHVALPYHRVALEFVGPGGAVTYAPFSSSSLPSHDFPASFTDSTPALLSLQVMWRAGLLRATGWTVVFIPVPLLSSQWMHCVTNEGGCTITATPNPFNTVSLLAKILPSFLHKNRPIKI